MTLGAPGTLGEGARLAWGTLTVVPVPPPVRVDRPVAAWAMTLAPAVGAVLAVPAGGLLWLLVAVDAPALLAGALAIGALAAMTRGMHLDGLADTADGLGSRRPAAEALTVMRRGDVGPFGVVTLVLILLAQVSALGALVDRGVGPAALALALLVSRLVLPLLCSTGVPAARADGLGSVVAGAVGRSRLVVAGALTAGLAVVPVLGLAGGPAAAAAVAGLLAGGALAHRAVRRLGGITGDVLGAAVEVAFTAVLVGYVVLDGVSAT